MLRPCLTPNMHGCIPNCSLLSELPYPSPEVGTATDLSWQAATFAERSLRPETRPIAMHMLPATNAISATRVTY